MTKQDLKQIEELMRKLLSTTATKLDLRKFATKNDLKRFATKNDLIALENRLVRKFATKEDLKIMEDNLSEEMASLFRGFNESIDEQKADRKDLEKLAGRVTTIESSLPQ